MIAYVPQTEGIVLSYYVKDYLALGRTPYIKEFSAPSEKDYEKVSFYAKDFISEKILCKRINQLSGGEWRIINIIRALVQETDIIIMDEPSAALDLANQIKLLREMMKLQKRKKNASFFDT